MLTCALSGKVPAQPVITKQGGVLYERRLVENYIDLHHCCPVTGEPLAKDDLLPVRHQPPPTPTPDGGPLLTYDPTTSIAHSATGVPTLVERLQTEWNGLMLEQHSLRQQLAQTQQELAMALHKHEAAIRVVAHLSRTCDALKAAASEKGKEGESGTAAPTCVVPAPVVEKMEEATRLVRDARKRTRESVKQQGSPTQGGLEGFGLEAIIGSPDTDKEEILPCTALTVLRSAASESGVDGLVGVGSVDGSIQLLHRRTGEYYTNAGVGHTDVVHSLTQTRSGLVLSGSMDRSVKVWRVSETPASAKASRTEGKDAASNQKAEETDASPSLTCVRTLRYAHSISCLAPQLLGDQFLLAGGGVHSPHLYLSDVERGDHVVDLDLSAATADGSGSGTLDHWWMPTSSTSSSPHSRLEAVSLHPYGTIAGLLLHTPSPHSSAEAFMSAASSTAAAVACGEFVAEWASGQSVVALWDVKAMRRDTLMPITARLLQEHQQQQKGPGAASWMGVAVSLDFAPDAFHFAVGLSSGAALLWDLRRVKEPVAVLPSPPATCSIEAAARTSPSQHSLPAFVRFAPGVNTPALGIATGSTLSFYDLNRWSAAQKEEEEKDGEMGCIKRVVLAQDGRGDSAPVFLSRGLSWAPVGDDSTSAFVAVGGFGSGVALCGPGNLVKKNGYQQSASDNNNNSNNEVYLVGTAASTSPPPLEECGEHSTANSSLLFISLPARAANNCGVHRVPKLLSWRRTRSSPLARIEKQCDRALRRCRPFFDSLISLIIIIIILY
eukprot:gene10300-7202_t